MPSLTWLTRDEDLKRAAAVPYRLLEADPALSHGDPTAGNMLIQGDNLDALKALLPYYKGRVKCIYIDPPYNTRSAISIFYDDNLEHSQWLGIIYPRLMILKELLSDDGLIFIQIDDHEQAYLTVVMDEVFGRSNRLNTISVKMSEATGVKMSHVTKRLPKMKEAILVYKNGGSPKISPISIPLNEWNEEYKEIIEGLSIDEVSELKDLLRQESANESDVERANFIVSKASVRSLSQVRKELELDDESFQRYRWDNAWRIVQAVGAGSIKSAAIKNRVESQPISSVLSARKKLYIFKTNFNEESRDPRIRFIFADFYLTYNPGDFWTDIKTTGGVGQEGGVEFPNGKKPEQLIRRIINLCTAKGDLVLDSFLGSGTTAAVAQKMARRYIGIEMGDHALTHCVPRLRNVVEGEQSGVSEIENWNGGGGFQFFRLGDPIFDESGRIRSGIKFPALAAHVWFSETGISYRGLADSPFLGTHGTRGFALLYNGILGDKSVSGGNVLTGALLTSIRAAAGHDGPLTIYGEMSRIGDARLKAAGVTFKQTPYDVKAR
ncbi:site-specific DNA-methyltransferase [Sphingopyxis sp. OPL5]|uniref:site-specific DNA-methyltransferase n=1 Tax=Sphingopyxis sp. OPL5 TaxID=2486273 RepID=UPI00164D481C|nr:site-specific DNA-methyltransferase [Sphingopyxis sp. OPL5]QNO27636.1 site-specific DNA-methyltransferase [Sphingopyxis sp. OPL5]